MNCSSTECKMVVVMLVPTGVGAEIGGHAGDATPAARLLASVCDTLIVHPNVVNGSDINEMPENALYVEGSTLDRFMAGGVRLLPVLANRILVAVNPPVRAETVNAVSAARATLGVDAEILVLKTPLRMTARIENNRAGGDVSGHLELIAQVREYEFDALAVATPIEVDRDVAESYLRNGGINPWGGVEAKASRLIAEAINKPIAHAPIDTGMFNDWNEVVDPRMAAEVVSECYLHCVLKGLHKAPWLDPDRGISVSDVTCVVVPGGSVSPPQSAAVQWGLPVIVVRENTTSGPVENFASAVVVENYLEAAGVLAAMKAGVNVAAVRRPLPTTVIKGA